MTDTGSFLDRDAFDRMFADSYQVLCVIAGAEAGQSHAEDVVHDAAIIALGKFDQFVPGTSFKAWMAAFVRHTAANHRRRESRRGKRLLRLVREAPPRKPATDGAGSGTGGATGGANGEGTGGLDPRLQGAIDGLREDQRCCFLLRVVLTRSYSEIGEIMAIPEATARSHVFRARERLLAELAGIGLDDDGVGGDGAGGDAVETGVES